MSQNQFFIKIQNYVDFTLLVPTYVWKKNALFAKIHFWPCNFLKICMKKGTGHWIMAWYYLNFGEKCIFLLEHYLLVYFNIDHYHHHQIIQFGHQDFSPFPGPKFHQNFYIRVIRRNIYFLRSRNTFSGTNRIRYRITL